jgi:hypothetical protein
MNSDFLEGRGSMGIPIRPGIDYVTGFVPDLGAVIPMFVI